jgi:hypothetical protein
LFCDRAGRCRTDGGWGRLIGGYSSANQRVTVMR